MLYSLHLRQHSLNEAYIYERVSKEFKRHMKDLFSFFPTGAVVVVVLIVVSDFHTLFTEIRTIKLQL